MTSFCIIVSPFGFLALGALTDSLLNVLKSKIKLKKFEILFRSITIIAICFFLLNISKIQNYHTEWKPKDNMNRNAELEQMEVIKKLSSSLPNDKFVVFNADKRFNGHIPILFYTDNVAYNFIPDQKQIEKIKSQSYKIAILDTDSLPDYILRDNDIVKIRL